MPSSKRLLVLGLTVDRLLVTPGTYQPRLYPALSLATRATRSWKQRILAKARVEVEVLIYIHFGEQRGLLSVAVGGLLLDLFFYQLHQLF